MAIEHQEVTPSVANIQEFLAQLDALEPSAQQKNTLLFQRLYPGVKRALERKVTQKIILERLNNMGLKLSMGGFRAQLQAEKERLANK
jgi:hypothetical protein